MWHLNWKMKHICSLGSAFNVKSYHQHCGRRWLWFWFPVIINKVNKIANNLCCSADIFFGDFFQVFSDILGALSSVTSEKLRAGTRRQVSSVKIVLRMVAAFLYVWVHIVHISGPFQNVFHSLENCSPFALSKKQPFQLHMLTAMLNSRLKRLALLFTILYAKYYFIIKNIKIQETKKATNMKTCTLHCR